MKAKIVCGVYRFNDAQVYEPSQAVKLFTKFHSAEVYADQCWEKKPVYGGYAVIKTDLQSAESKQHGRGK